MFSYATEDAFDLDLEMSAFIEASNRKEALFTGELSGTRMQDQLWSWTIDGESEWCVFEITDEIEDMEVRGDSFWDMSFTGPLIGGWGSGTWLLHGGGESYEGGWEATLD